MYHVVVAGLMPPRVGVGVIGSGGGVGAEEGGAGVDGLDGRTGAGVATVRGGRAEGLGAAGRVCAGVASRVRPADASAVAVALAVVRWGVGWWADGWWADGWWADGCRCPVPSAGVDRSSGGVAGRVRPAPVGAVEREPAGVEPVERGSDAVGGGVLGVSGLGVQVGRGPSVGRDKSAEDEGSGRGVSPSCVTKAHTPTPPRASMTAPPAIHGARRGGRR
ncbi:hypothetical protein AB0N31_35160 [Streptomyces sp. NPDC051051]|uniref:hypothetical protein n=1 Tax=Streptomyces sp. NPDC051051 TaxID=3155666 RepID=UPI003429129E